MIKKRFENIDVVRGIAAMLVVWKHATERTNLIDPASIFSDRGINLGQMGVIAFFLVSGFVIPLSLERSNSIGRFALNRALRIYPLYVFVFTLSCLLLYGVPSIKDTIAQMMFASEYLHAKNFVANSWTLSIEAAWYVVFAGLFVLGRNRSTLLIAIVTASTIFAAAAIKMSGVNLPLGRICMLATCVIGMFAYRAFVERERCGTAITTVGVAILAGLYAGFEMPAANVRGVITLQGVIISWLAAYALFFGSFVINFGEVLQTSLKKLGEISYSLYLVHTFSLYAMVWIGLSGGSYVAAVIVSSIAAASFTYTYIELPAIRLGHRWPRRNIAAIAAEPTALVDPDPIVAETPVTTPELLGYEVTPQAAKHGVINPEVV